MTRYLLSTLALLQIAVIVLLTKFRGGYKRGYSVGREEGYEKGFAAGQVRTDNWWMGLDQEADQVEKKSREQRWP